MLKVPVTDKDHMQGNINAPIKLVEYGDYECGYCGMAHPIVKRIQEFLGERLLFVFRHFPLSQIHPHAEYAAETAEFSANYDRFWQMHDLLFENQNRLSMELILELVAALELPLDEYESAIEQRILLPKVKEDFMSGVANGVNGTPTFFINGKRYNGIMNFEDLLYALENAQ